MKSFIITFLGIFLGLIQAQAQDCNAYFPIKEGTEITHKNYDGKDKYQGSTKTKVVSKDIDGNNMTVNLDATMYDKKDKETFVKDMVFRCEEGQFYIDLKSLLNDDMLKSYNESMDMKVTQEEIYIPHDAKAGDDLPDGQINVQLSMSGMTLMNMTVKVTNRKIEKEESITTEAGTYTCLVYSYDMITDAGMVKMQNSAKEWYALNTGLIRSENYDKNGKLDSYSVLTSFVE